MRNLYTSSYLYPKIKRKNVVLSFLSSGTNFSCFLCSIVAYELTFAVLRPCTLDDTLFGVTFTVWNASVPLKFSHRCRFWGENIKRWSICLFFVMPSTLIKKNENKEIKLTENNPHLLLSATENIEVAPGKTFFPRLLFSPYLSKLSFFSLRFYSWKIGSIFKITVDSVRLTVSSVPSMIATPLFPPPKKNAMTIFLSSDDGWLFIVSGYRRLVCYISIWATLDITFTINVHLSLFSVIPHADNFTLKKRIEPSLFRIICFSINNSEILVFWIFSGES